MKDKRDECGCRRWCTALPHDCEKPCRWPGCLSEAEASELVESIRIESFWGTLMDDLVKASCKKINYYVWQDAWHSAVDIWSRERDALQIYPCFSGQSVHYHLGHPSARDRKAIERSLEKARRKRLAQVRFRGVFR